MSVGGVCYPLTDEVRANVLRFPNIGSYPKLLAKNPSPLEIVRLLDNTHYEGVDALLKFIDDSIPKAGSIGQGVLAQTSPFQLEQRLAELFAIAHVESKCPNSTMPSEAALGSKNHDFDIFWSTHRIRCEVYCPVDFIGLQLVEFCVSRIFKYLDVPQGFSMDISLLSSQSMDFSYAHSIGNEQVITKWLTDLAANARAWLHTARSLESCDFPGPTNAWSVHVKLNALLDDNRAREISYHSPTRSTDTRQIFETRCVSDTANSGWGKKLKDKLSQMQCGAAKPDSPRMLILDFSLADTGWPDFICWPQISRRLEETAKMICEKIGPPLPYDVVLPAQLGLSPCFGRPIWLDEDLRKNAEPFIASAGLLVPCKRRPSTFETDWVKFLRAGRQ